MDRRRATRTGACVIAIVALVAGCAPAFDRGEKPEAEFERDQGVCLRDNTERTAARYGPSRHTDWHAYADCMHAKGYADR